MSFVQFPLALILAGSVALAGILYLLQQLRARPRVVRLPAAMLWQRIVHDAPVRVLRKSFRYWLAYLLALSIALALWIAAAVPERDVAATRDMRNFYLDASALMTSDSQFAAAKSALLADVRATPADRRRVYLGDARGATLLEPGENVALLARRLQGVAPGSFPSRFVDWVAWTRGRRDGGGVRYYGAWPVVRGTRLPRVTYGYLAPAVAGNRGIVALGVSPAASGGWDRADVLVATAAAAGPPPGFAGLRVSIDGVDAAPARIDAQGDGQVVLRDIAAAGGMLRVALREGDALRADDVATLTLPDRQPIRVAIGAGVPRSVREVVRLDPAFVASDPATAQVVIRRAGDGIAPTLPAMVLTEPRADTATFVYARPDDGSGDDLSGQVEQLGLAQIDTTALADQLQRPVAVDIAIAARRSVAIWSPVFDDNSGFVKSREMPPFVSQSLRWLAGPQPWIAYARAGEAPFDQSALYGLAAGSYRSGDRAIAVSLTDRRVTLAQGTSPPAVERSGGGGSGPDLPFTLLIVVAGLLLAAEWHFVQRGVMP